MSYDLSFLTREGKTLPSMDDMRKYFERRRHYKLSNSQAFYENEDTGVYFSFDFEESDPADGKDCIAPISFNLNFYRPHIFGLEAEPEVSKFVDEFGMLVQDPQIDGMGGGEYSPEGFLRGWNYGNRFGYQALLDSDPPPEHLDVLPTDLIEKYWRWNFGRSDLQERMGDGIFVPMIMFLRHECRIASFVVWSDAMPFVLPEVDSISLYRYELAQRRWFKKKPTIALIPFSRFGSLQLGAEKFSGPMDYWVINHYPPPPELAQLFREEKEIPEKLDGVAVDKILNEELVEEFRKD